jgi:hypothetical protein
MAMLDQNRLMFGAMLLVLIAIAEIVLHEFNLPAWPVFFVMMFFFLAHMDKKTAPNIIIGALVGIGCFIVARPVIAAIAPITGIAVGRLLYLLVVVGAIILFREKVPMALNDYAFAYLLLSGLASKALPSPHSPFIWMAVTLFGGTIIIFAILGIRKIVVAIARKKAIKRAAAAAPPPSL